MVHMSKSDSETLQFIKQSCGDDTVKSLIGEEVFEVLEKAKKSGKLVPVQKRVIKDGVAYTNTYWVSPEEARTINDKHEKHGAFDYDKLRELAQSKDKKAAIQYLKDHNLKWQELSHAQQNWLKAHQSALAHVREVTDRGTKEKKPLPPEIRAREKRALAEKKTKEEKAPADKKAGESQKDSVLLKVISKYGLLENTAYQIGHAKDHARDRKWLWEHDLIMIKGDELWMASHIEGKRWGQFMKVPKESHKEVDSFEAFVQRRQKPKNDRLKNSHKEASTESKETKNEMRTAKELGEDFDALQNIANGLYKKFEDKRKQFTVRSTQISEHSTEFKQLEKEMKEAHEVYRQAQAKADEAFQDASLQTAKERNAKSEEDNSKKPMDITTSDGNVVRVEITGKKELSGAIPCKLIEGLKVGDLVGIRIKSTRNHNVYGKIVSGGKGFIKWKHPESGSIYKIGLTGELNHKELRLQPYNNSGDELWFAFLDLNKEFRMDN